MDAIADDRTIYDAIIVGAGPAGLSAALLLGRCRDRVLVLDDGQPRNRNARAAHGFLTRDGEAPEHIRRSALDQLRPYDVRLQSCHVTKIERHAPDLFAVVSESQMWFGRKVLLATGMRERDLQIPGVLEHLGDGVHCCPYCDGWEVRDGKLGGLATGAGAADYALALLTWSPRVTLFTHNDPAMAVEDRERLERHGVVVVEGAVESVSVRGPRAVQVQLVDGRQLTLDALFVHAGQHQPSPLAVAAGCELNETQSVCAQGNRATRVPGLFVAGDAESHVESIAVAAAEGYRAALEIHRELHREHLSRANDSFTGEART
jgi:thioredoxin reductase